MVGSGVKELKYYKYKQDAYFQLNNLIEEIYKSRGRTPYLGRSEFDSGCRFKLDCSEKGLTVFVSTGIYCHINIVTGAVMLNQEGFKLIYLKDHVIERINDALETLNSGILGKYSASPLIGAEYGRFDLVHFFEDIVIVSKFRG